MREISASATASVYAEDGRWSREPIKAFDLKNVYPHKWYTDREGRFVGVYLFALVTFRNARRGSHEVRLDVVDAATNRSVMTGAASHRCEVIEIPTVYPIKFLCEWRLPVGSYYASISVDGVEKTCLPVQVQNAVQE